MTFIFLMVDCKMTLKVILLVLHNGASVVNYIIASPCLFQFCIEFEIGDTNQSIHFLVTCCKGKGWSTAIKSLPTPSYSIAARPMMALLFRFFGDFRMRK